MRRRHGHLRCALALAVVLAACGGSGSTATPATPTAAQGQATDEVATGPSTGGEETASELPKRTIAVRGDALVGEELTALISTDLVGQIESWGWHRCIRIPACQTIPGATTSSYTPTVDDAWHVLRVIAVAARDDGSSGGVSAVIGPVINPDPEPFHQEMTVDASDLVGVRFIVAPGPVSLKVDAACPVQVVAGIRTATPEGSTITAEYTGDEPAKNHTHILDGDGGELTVGVIGECSTATITVDATL